MKKDRRRLSGKGTSTGKHSRGSIETPQRGKQAGDPMEVLNRIPRWVPPLLFAFVTAVLFREFIFSQEMLIGLDTFSLGYAARAFFSVALQTTGFPLWNPQILGGTPFIESLAGGDTLYPPSFLLLFLSDTYRALGWKLVLHVFLAGVFMHLWLRALGVSRAGSMIGGLAFLTAPYFVSLVFPGHDGKIFVTALTPLLFLVTEFALTRKGVHWLSAVGGVVGAIILTTHFQMAYFLFGGVGAYALFRTIQRAKESSSSAGEDRLDPIRDEPPVRSHAPWVRFALFLCFTVLGAGAAGVQLLPALDYVSEYSRRTATTTAAEGSAAVAYSSSWSLHPEEVVSLIVPEFVGANTEYAGTTFEGSEWASQTYWGRNAIKFNSEYLGLLTLLLAAVSFLGAPSRGIRWFFAGLGLTAFFFALGAHTPIWRIFYEVLPGIALFRAPSMAIFLTGFAATSLAGIGFDRAATLLATGEGRRLLRLLGVITGILLVAWLTAFSGLLSQGWLALFNPNTTGIRQEVLAAAEPFFIRGFFLAFLFALAIFLLWWGVSRRVFSLGVATVAVVLLVVVDNARVNEAFLGTVDFAQFSTPDANQQFLIERAEIEEPFRVFSMMQGGQDVSPAMYGLDLAGGHHPNDLLRYRDLIGMQGGGVPEHLATFNPNVLRILNVRYIVWPDAEYPLEGGPAPLNQITFPDGRPYASVYPFPGLPRARIVREAIVVPEEEVLDVLLGNHEIDYDPFTQTVLSSPPPIDLSAGDASGSVQWVERTPNRLLLEVQSSGSGLLVLSENWFPGWKARVDGREVEVLRADHTLRAIPIEVGSHEVEFYYASSLLTGSLWLSLFCAFLLLGIGGWSLRSSFRE